MFKVFTQILRKYKFYVIYHGYIKITLNEISLINKNIVLFNWSHILNDIKFNIEY